MIQRTYVCRMNYKEARQEFIATWGTLGNEWGINRTMSQIHALLLISPDPLTTEDLMNELSISRGNANMNLHSLMDWGLIQKVLIQGERKEYFQAEKDVWKIARIVARERKKRELDPMLVLLKKVKKMEANGRDRQAKHLKNLIEDLSDVAEKTDKSLQLFLKADEQKFWSLLLKAVV